MIEVQETQLPNVLKITNRGLFGDFRGIYGEIYKKKEYFDAGIKIEFVEQDFSLSHKNVLRGF